MIRSKTGVSTGFAIFNPNQLETKKEIELFVRLLYFRIRMIFNTAFLNSIFH